MKKSLLMTIGLASLLAFAAQASQEQLAKSIQEARIETTGTSEQLKVTLATLNALTKQKKGDLRPAYDAFAAEIPKTEAAAALTRTRIQWMNGDGQSYFADWQKTISGIANEGLRKKAQKRLDTVKKSYGKVEKSLQLAVDKFKLFTSDLTDIQKALSTDVTAGGVKAIKGTVRNANWDHQHVDNAVKAALQEMVKMEKALTAEAK